MKNIIFRNIERPTPAEYGPATAPYLALTDPHQPILELLEQNAATIVNLFMLLPAKRLLHRYEKNKWTLKEVLQHLIDDERIYCYRALRFARNDQHTLHGFDQDLYTQQSGANERTIESMVLEYQAVRLSTLAFFNGLPEAALKHRGATNEFHISVRALLYHIAGHEINHLHIIHTKYIPEIIF